MNLVEADNAESLSQLLADKVAQQLVDALDESGQASLVVSGGSTPVPFFKHLSRAAIDWPKVIVSLADERWVPLQHKDSNARLVNENLLQNNAATANFCSLYDDAANSPEEGLAVIEARLRRQLPMPITVLILGMGTDGHTASLFPDTCGLENAMSLENPKAVEILHPAASPLARISMTRRRLLDSEHRYLHVTGPAKRALIDTIDTESGQRLPIARFLDQPPIAVYWSP